VRWYYIWRGVYRHKWAFKEYMMYSLVVVGIGTLVATSVGVWPRAGVPNLVATGGAHKSTIKLCLPLETCKLYAKRKQLRRLAFGIYARWMLIIMLAPCIHSEVKLYLKCAFASCAYVCARVTGVNCNPPYI